MLVNAREMLNDAKIKKYAVPQFNINNLEWTKYILEECEINNSPVILGASEGAIKYMGGYNVVSNLVKSLIKDLNITIPVVLHLDHGTSLDNCKKAIDAGFTSVMIDASKYELDKNIEITSEVVNYAKSRGVTVEAEVGHIGGTEDNITSNVAYAKKEEVIKFAEKTNVDFFAPAVGSSHGPYKGQPKLDFDLIYDISKITNLPLVLHGGSGIEDELIKKAIQCGICKLNINTDLQIEWSKAVSQFIKDNPETYDPRKIIGSGQDEIKKQVKNKIQLLGCNQHHGKPITY